MRRWKSACILIGVFFWVANGSGQASEDTQRHGATTSPDGTRVVYHLDYDYYAPAASRKPMVFRVAKAGTEEVLHEIEVPYLGKVPPKIHWIDERFVLLTSRLAAILDTHVGTATDTVYGFGFEMAPDKRSIAYLHGYVPMYFDPTDPPEDHVFIWYRGADDLWTTTVVYPEKPAPQVKVEKEPPFNERDLLASNFAWSPSGKQLAFLVFRGGEYELVVLGLQGSPGGLHVQRRIVPPPSNANLPEFRELSQIHQSAKLLWTEDPEKALVLVHDGKTYPVLPGGE